MVTPEKKNPQTMKTYGKNDTAGCKGLDFRQGVMEGDRA